MPFSDEKKKLYFQSLHRGCKELDILLGSFAREELDVLEGSEVEEYKRLLDVADDKLFKWITGMEEVPREFDSQLMQRLIKFCHEKKKV